MSSSDLEEVNPIIKSVLVFPAVEERLNPLCDEISSAEFYEESGDRILETIRSWRKYNAANHTVTENLTFSRSILMNLKCFVQMDTDLSNDELKDENKKTKKTRMETLGLGLASGLTYLASPALGLSGLTKCGEKAMTMNDNLKAQKRKTWTTVDRNRRFIRAIDDILCLL